MNNERDEHERWKAEIEASKDPGADAYDDPDDKTAFVISVVNRRNQALSVDCVVSNGVVAFNQW